LGWDEVWSEEASLKFANWMSEIEALGNIKIRRCAALSHSRVELHTFVDASQYAYAAVVYSRVKTQDEVIVSLLSAKSRLAPIQKKKPVTIPRLELLGCLIGSRLANSVKEALRLKGVEEFYWTDSSTALAWIKRQEHWGTFVGNRTAEIGKLTNIENWRHVPGELNPADLPSRGCSPKELMESKWWEGPEWLIGDPSQWPNYTPELNEEEIEQELRKTPAKSNMVVPEEQPRFSRYLSNVKIFGWVWRFIENSRKRKEYIEICHPC